MSDQGRHRAVTSNPRRVRGASGRPGDQRPSGTAAMPHRVMRSYDARCASTRPTHGACLMTWTAHTTFENRAARWASWRGGRKRLATKRRMHQPVFQRQPDSNTRENTESTLCSLRNGVVPQQSQSRQLKVACNRALNAGRAVNSAELRTGVTHE